MSVTSLQEVRVGRRLESGSVWRGCAVVLLLTCVASSTPISDADATPQPVGDAQATVETAPVANAGDAADDPAIWRDPVDPSRSIVIGNDKMGALEVYDMSGALIQRFTGGFFGNVDTRTAMSTGVGLVKIAVTYRQGIRIYGSILSPGS